MMMMAPEGAEPMMMGDADEAAGMMEGETKSGIFVFLEWTHESTFLFQSLEPTVTDLRRGIDKFQSDLLEIPPLVVVEERFPKHDGSLSATHAGTFEHQKVVFDLTVVGESTDWVDRFIGPVGFGGSVVFVDFTVFGFVTGTESVDFFVDLNTVVITFLATPGDSKGYPCWMPSTDTSDFPETSVGFSGKFLGSPS